MEELPNLLGGKKRFRTKFPEVGWTGVDGYTGNELTDELNGSHCGGRHSSRWNGDASSGGMDNEASGVVPNTRSWRTLAAAWTTIPVRNSWPHAGWDELELSGSSVWS